MPTAPHPHTCWPSGLAGRSVMDPEGKREAGAFFSLAALSDETPHSRDHLKPGLQDPPNPSSTLLSPHLPLVVRGGGSKGENPRKASSWLCPTLNRFLEPLQSLSSLKYIYFLLDIMIT